jgi:SpoVK/Ycf46/Vps4 family AAA+-type ATPase
MARRIVLRTEKGNRGPEALEGSEINYIKGKVATYIVGLIERGLINLAEEEYPHFYECVDWCLDSLRPIVRKALESLPREDDSEPKITIETLEKEFLSYGRHLISRSRSMSNILEKLDDIGLSGEIIQSAIASSCNEVIKKMGKAPSAMRKAKVRLKHFFGFDENTISVLEFLFIIECVDKAEDFFNDDLGVLEHLNERLLSSMLDIGIKEIREIKKNLRATGFINSGRRREYGDISDILCFWDESFSEDSAEMFCRPLCGNAMPLSNFNIPESDTSHIVSLLKSGGGSPLHILLYGQPGAGKTAFASSLAKELGITAWSVPHNDASDEQKSRRIGLTMCLHLASKKPGSVVLLDEADRFLDSSDRFGRHTVDKAWLNELLERQGIRMIWIVNDVSQIDHSTRRRFTYSLHFDQHGVKERRIIWSGILEKYGAKRMIPSEETERLARDYEISPATIDSAVSQAKSIGASKKNFAATTERIIRSHLTLMENGKKPGENTRELEKFSPESACVDGDLDGLMARCRIVDETRRAGNIVPPGVATMLFYGPPGTGKTALAKYVAEQLDKPLITKRASDLLSPYVGVAEKNIAEAFSRADREDAVLLVDEVDSFLYSRDASRKSWENTLVNEFLTSLEECRVFCICTTNRMDDLDAATLRRFSLKLNFSYAKPHQAESLYNAILAELAAGRMSSHDRGRLLSLTRLTPGDFRVVRNQKWFEPKGSLTHAKLIAALEEEQDVKLRRDGRQIGF